MPQYRTVFLAPGRWLERQIAWHRQFRERERAGRCGFCDQPPPDAGQCCDNARISGDW